jgi:hypothetical protein
MGVERILSRPGIVMPNSRALAGRHAGAALTRAGPASLLFAPRWT